MRILHLSPIGDGKGVLGIHGRFHFLRTAGDSQQHEKQGQQKARSEPLPRVCAESFVLLLSPSAPHIAEELWRHLGHSNTLAYEPWPTADESLLVDELVTLAVQVNGKRRDEIQVASDATQDSIREAALGPSDMRVASALNELGLSLHDSGDLAAARPMLERSLAIAERAQPPDLHELQLFLNNLARLMRDMGDHDAARPLYERALSVASPESTSPSNRAIAIQGLARVLHAQGRSKDAKQVEEEFRRAWAGADGPITTSCECVPEI